MSGRNNSRNLPRSDGYYVNRPSTESGYINYQNARIGSKTTNYQQPDAPRKSNPDTTSTTYDVPVFAETPVLTTVPTINDEGAYWTTNGEYRGQGTTLNPPSDEAEVFEPGTANNTGEIKGYNIFDLLGGTTMVTNLVAKFDVRYIITREQIINSTDYKYYLKFLPFSQPNSSQTSYIYDTIVPENTSAQSTFFNKPNTNFRLVLKSLSTDPDVNTQTALSDSTIFQPTRLINNYPTSLRVQSNAVVSGLVGKQNMAPIEILYQAFINVSSSQNACNSGCSSYGRYGCTPVGSNSGFPIYGYSTSTNSKPQPQTYPLKYGSTTEKSAYISGGNNPYPFEHIQSKPSTIVSGDVIGQKIVFYLVEATSQNNGIEYATQESFPANIEFTYEIGDDGYTPCLRCQYSSSGDEPELFTSILINGIEFTDVERNPKWKTSENIISNQNACPTFSTPVPYSAQPYDPNNKALTCDISLLIRMTITV